MSTRTLKVVVIGDGSAGKTSLRSRYLHSSFQRAYVSTIGADFISKTVTVSIPVPAYSKGASKGKGKKREPAGEAEVESTPTLSEETVRVNLSIWDTAGQERFKSLGSAFYRGSDAVIVAFDLSERGALARTMNWYNDFCRLGDVGWEEPGMDGRQLKRAREQRERFCWVAVGCKGDLLPVPTAGVEEPEWKGTGWTEARGWFDTMIPRSLPRGEVESEGYPPALQHKGLNGKAQAATEASSGPYSVQGEIPARPEDVLSRPNKLSTSSRATNGRPAEAGLAPGNAPAPGTSPSQKPREAESHQRRVSRSKKIRGQRKSIRSIEVWQGENQSTPSLSNDTNNSSPRAIDRDEIHQRNRYDSTASVGGPPSIYYSVRGSTFFSQSPGTNSSSPDSGVSERTINRGGQNSRGLSLSSQVRNRKQSNLSEVLTNEDDERGEEREGGKDAVSTNTNGSAKTVKGLQADGSTTTPQDDDESLLLGSSVTIPTVPSGDPIPFPSSDDVDEEGAHLETQQEEEEVPRRRGKGRKVPLSGNANGKGELAHKAEVIAGQVRQDGKGGQDEGVDARMTLYSARPSSIASTIKAANAAESGSEADGDDDDAHLADPGHIYRSEMIEQGFRLFYTSAKDGQGIDEVFEHIARRVAMKWKLEEWEEEGEREQGGPYGPGHVRTVPPTDEEVERERVKRAIKISSGKGTGSCCS